MIPNSVKAKILRSVAGGATLSQAGTTAGISTASARTALGSLCRTLMLRADSEAIHAQPQKYLEALLEFESKPQFELRRALVDKLEQALMLRSAAELPQPVEKTMLFLKRNVAEQQRELRTNGGAF